MRGADIHDDAILADGGLEIISGGFRGAGPSRGCDCPARLLLEPVVMPALRAAVTQARPSARLVRGVVLEVALGGGSPADRAGAGGVPDLGQVPQPDPGVVAPGLVPVLAVPGVQGVDRDDQVRPASRDAQPPGAVSAGRAVPAGRGEGRTRSRPAGRVRRVSGGSWVRAGRSRARRRGRARRSPSRTTSSSGSARRRRPGRGPARGRPGRARPARRAGPPGRPRCPAARSG